MRRIENSYNSDALATLLPQDFVHNALQGHRHHDSLVGLNGDPLQFVFAEQILKGEL